MREDLFRGSVVGNFSVVHDDDAVSIIGHILHAVGDEQDRNASLVMKFLNLVENIIPALRIESRCRLIKDEDLRVHREYARDGYASLLPAG